MIVDVIEYKVWQGNHIKIRSHHYRKGKIVPNPKWEFHKIITSNILPGLLFFIREYKEELKERKWCG